MGRNILRRSPLILTYLIFGILPVTAMAGEKIPPRNLHSMPSSVGTTDITINKNPREIHRQIDLWSVNLPDKNLIDQYILYFGEGKGLDYINRCLERAEPFWDFINSRLAEKKMPREIIYLPLIESAYRSDAVSRSGAAGMWQFMMNSIDPYDITVDAWRDDRRDFWRATESALEKLEYNYSKTGDWLLALAAYNCGLNKILRTVESSGINDYWELCDKGLLPRETRNYIPKMAAVAYICESRGKAGISLSWDKPVQWNRIPLKRSVDIRRVARKAEIPEDILFLAHRELNYSVTPPPGNSYYLKVPEQYRAQLEAALNEDSDLISFKRYKIQSGDTLSEIAQWYKIPVTYIEEYNPGVESRYLRIGQILLVPIIDDSIPDKPGFLSDENSVPWSGEYTVQAGDSLWRIAMKHNRSPEEIAAGNGLPLESTIRPGMKLLVPAPGE